MTEEINVTVTAKVKNGLTMSFSNPLKIDAYDKLDILVATGQTKTVQLLPTGTTAVHFLLIKANQYTDINNKKITYTVNATNPVITLDTPQSFIGEGSLAALDSANVPGTLEFTNNLADDVDIQILVGRDAVT